MANQQLIDYIKKQLEQGADQVEIKNTLITSGWQETDIQEALDSALGRSATQVVPPPPTSQVQTVQVESEQMKMIVTIILLVTVWPAGIILMWVWTTWKTWVKLLITIIPVILVIIVLIFMFGVFFLEALFVAVPSETQKKVLVTEPVEKNFEKVEGDNYVFSYPKGYVKSEPREAPAGQREILRYVNPSTKAVEAESIALRVESLSGRMQKPDYQLCSKAAEDMRQKPDDEIKGEVAHGGKEGWGCETVLKINIGSGIDDSVVRVEKSLWYETGDDFTVYSAIAIYYALASQDEAARLDLAVDQFTLK